MDITGTKNAGRLPALAAAVLLLLLPCISSAEIKLGILPRLGAMELHDMFSPLAEYLSREIGEKVVLVIPRDFEAFEAAVRAGDLDLGFANSLVYVRLKNAVEGLEPLAVAAEAKSGTRFRGIIVVRKDSELNRLQDLRGKSLIFVDRDSAAGYFFQMLLLDKARLLPGKDFTILPFAKKHDNVVMAVYTGTADAGGIREDDLVKMKDKVDLSRLRIIGYTEYFPNWPLFCSPALSQEMRAKIRSALLKLKTGRSNSGVLAASGLTGFAPVSDKDYDGLRRAAGLAATPEAP